MAFEGTAEEKLILWGRPDMKHDDTIQMLGQESGTMTMKPNKESGLTPEIIF